ncbi:MAG TPA: flagellar export chaperone FliS [Planctomycetes bacterium]|nr:flagellar export chaperone FliS [Planctomycetota bacterium]
MDPHSAASVYEQNTFESAPPLKIVHMMYEGALRFLDQAVQFDPQTQPTEFNDRLSQADAVVSELRLSLAPEHAPDIAEHLNALYLFVEGQIREAFLERTAEPIPAARDILETLLEGWREIQLEGEEPQAGN